MKEIHPSWNNHQCPICDQNWADPFDITCWKCQRETREQPTVKQNVEGKRDYRTPRATRLIVDTIRVDMTNLRAVEVPTKTYQVAQRHAKFNHSEGGNKPLLARATPIGLDPDTWEMTVLIAVADTAQNTKPKAA